MAVKVTSTDGIGWRTVHNKVNEKTINGSLLHTLKSTKKIKRRTRALNIKLKRHVSRSYRRYVKIKTVILRNITDNEDTDDNVDTYRVGIQSTRDNSPLRCSSQSEDVTMGSPNSESANPTDFTSLPRKQKKQTRRKDIIEFHSSATVAKRNLNESRSESQATSVDNAITHTKGLTKVKRNLTSLLENFEDDNSIIDESMEIDERNEEDNYESSRNTEAEDSVQLENSYNDMIAQNTEFDSDSMSVNSDAVSNDKPMIECAEEAVKLEQEQEQTILEEKLMKKSQTVVTCLAEAEELEQEQEQTILEEKLTKKSQTVVTCVAEAEELEQEQEQTILEEKLIKKSQTVVTCLAEAEELELEQEQTILEEKLPKKSQTVATCVAEAEELDQEQEESMLEEKLKKKSKPVTTCVAEAEELDQEQEESMLEEKLKKKSQPVATCVAETEEVEQEQEESMLEEKLMKKSQPVITSTEIVRSKYTIVRDEDETTDDEDTSDGESSVLKTSPSSGGNEFLTDQQASPAKKLSPESKRVGIDLVSSNSSDSRESQNDRVDANKQVASPDIDAGSSRGHTFLTDQVARQAKKRSVESKRVGQGKGINLVLFNSSDSDENQASKEDRVDSNKYDPSPISNCHIDESEESAWPSCSQIISDPINSDESNADPDDTNHHPITPSSSISDKAKLPNTVMSKSIISQIREQENFYSSTPLKKITESSTKESDNNSGREEEEQVDGNYPRPMELCEFVERERLVPTEELSTITAKDFKEFTLENGDEEIWLMEIPKSIITDDDELCGKTMTFENEKMTINGTTYKTTCRDDKSVTCILRSRKKKTRFKTVNVEAVGCIVVRQEVSEKEEPPLSVQCPRQFESVVPFPKNLKSRNPLLGVNSLNGTDHFKHLEHRSSGQDTHEIFQSKKKVKRKEKGIFEPLYFT